jgi:hypothetical protein
MCEIPVLQYLQTTEADNVVTYSTFSSAVSAGASRHAEPLCGSGRRDTATRGITRGWCGRRELGVGDSVSSVEDASLEGGWTRDTLNGLAGGSEGILSPRVGMGYREAGGLEGD